MTTVRVSSKFCNCPVMRTFWPTAKSGAPPWTWKCAFISAPYQRGMRCGTKKTKISLAVVEIFVASSMRAIVRERYLTVCADLNFDEDQGDVVGGRALAPFGYAVQDAFLHFVEGEAGSFADDFLHAFDAEHFAAGIEDVGDAVGVEHDAVARVEIHVEGGFGVHGFGESAENHAAGFEQARLGAVVRDHGGRMSSAGEDHAAAGAVNARGGDGEKENRTADI